MPELDHDAVSIDLHSQPGHLIRRAHQIAVSVFANKIGGDVTPIQYAVLRTLEGSPGIDQLTLGREIAVDSSTIAELAVRLESKGWIHRDILARGQRSLTLTDAGRELLANLVPNIHALQDTLLGNLSKKDASDLIRLLAKFVEVNNDLSRAPLKRRK